MKMKTQKQNRNLQTIHKHQTTLSDCITAAENCWVKGRWDLKCLKVPLKHGSYNLFPLYITFGQSQKPFLKACQWGLRLRLSIPVGLKKRLKQSVNVLRHIRHSSSTVPAHQEEGASGPAGTSWVRDRTVLQFLLQTVCFCLVCFTYRGMQWLSNHQAISWATSQEHRQSQKQHSTFHLSENICFVWLKATTFGFCIEV